LPSLFSNTKQKEFWALKNINFEIKKGERIGIIGPNGSGKTTLLKILTGITYPTRGEININGRVAALLEIGAGFHPDLTGKENIFLSGSILGMNTSEINKNYKKIVDFSGVKKFLDTPVKYYSSGMFLRLAFSVSIYLEWDILLLDEVLGVGDYEFQERSLAKIDEIVNLGKTIVLVSHDLNSIIRICTKTILLINGKIRKIGENKAVINFYQNQQNEVQMYYK